MKNSILLFAFLLFHLATFSQSASDELMVASITGDVEKLNAAIAKGARYDIKDGDGLSPLSIAAKSGHVPIVIVLLDNGAPLEAKDNLGLTPLMHAAREGQVDIVGILLEKGAQIEARNKKGLTALMMAAENGHHGAMGLLLEKGATPKFTLDAELEVAKTADTKENASANLLNAILKHDEAAAIAALKQGALPDARSKRHIPALIMAASRKQHGIVVALLEAGADVNIRATDTEKGIEQITPMHVAAANGDVDILRALISAGGKVNSQEKTGLTPLMSAAELGNIVSIILLIDHGAEVNMQANDGVSALLLAANNNNLDAARILLEKGADPNLADGEMTTPMMLAAQGGFVEMVQLLLDNKADPKLRRGANGYRAVDFAKVAGHKEVVKLLKE